ncbi:endolytic transglycosylase MltG [Paenibacillus xanthanilyticus]|uniref:Endolytic murein transglycosylase n=1 Tax=Paenibacillus xanthanilyticus TaxID=1783531 RepID=A0ABV8K1C4_9BACL
MDYQKQPVKGAQDAGRSARRGPSKARITLWVITSLLGLFIVIAASIAFYIWNGLRPAPAGDVREVVLENGMSPFEFAQVLEDQGIIRNGFIFKYYLRYKDEGSRFQAGTYELTPGMDIDAVIAKLNAGETVEAETIRFTIPEGFTVKQIADALSKEGLVDRDAFLALADGTSQWADVEAIRGIPDNKDLKHRLEGYLFPETYEMEKGSTAEQIMDRMLKELDRKLVSLPEEWEEAMKERGVTFHELMTIASLVEREVVVDKERALVAGVIYNRLKAKMPLQIDATVQYLLDKQKERLLVKDLEVESPYNTYKTNGLPPGPIASPSLKSIEAALYPETSEFLFYVTKKDGSNEHLFARTFSEHNRNIRKSNETSTQN